MMFEEMCPSKPAQGTSCLYELLRTKPEPDAIMRSNLWELLGESDCFECGDNEDNFWPKYRMWRS